MIKNRLIKLALLAGYLNIILLSVGFQWSALLDVKLLLLVAVGMACLSVPELFCKCKISKTTLAKAVGIMGKNAIPAGIIQSFLLLFSESSNHGAEPSGSYQAALCFRPLFYGYCLFILLCTEETDKKLDRKETQETLDTHNISDTPKMPPEPGKSSECSPDFFPHAIGTPPNRLLREMGLTTREAEIGVFLLKGYSNGEIAAELTISETTVKKHVSNIFQKLDISRREQILDAVMKRTPPGRAD